MNVGLIKNNRLHISTDQHDIWPNIMLQIAGVMCNQKTGFSHCVLRVLTNGTPVFICSDCQRGPAKLIFQFMLHTPDPIGSQCATV